MDKRKISQDVYDRYVDATVALFMEYYCVALSEDIHKEIVEMQAEDKAFPDALDARCRAAIKKEVAVRKRRKCFKSIVKGLRYVAAVAIVLLALTSVLFVSVEAIRVPIINYYISATDKYLEFGVSSAVTTEPTVNLDWDNPLAGFLPKEYALSVCKGDHSSQLVAIYDNSVGDSIFFTMDPASDIKKIDSEGAQVIKDSLIAGNEAIIIIKNDITTLVWKHETLGKTFSITAASLSEMEIIDIAEGVMQGITS